MIKNEEQYEKTLERVAYLFSEAETNSKEYQEMQLLLRQVMDYQDAIKRVDQARTY